MTSHDEEDDRFLIREPLAFYGKNKFTEDEYLDFERNSLERHEYYKGEIFQMAVPDREHTVIHTNVFGRLFKHLEDKPCQPYTNALRIRVKKNTLYTYPDISIICYDFMKEEENEEDEKNSVIEPSVIIEILSPKTRNYDQGDQFRLYKDIPRFAEYIIIDSRSILVQTNLKNEAGFWATREFKNPEDSLFISTADFTLPFSEIYKGTNIIK
jgi:Uma2 family endonuclease